MTRVAYIQEWEESEAGWGTRPDGFRIYATQDAAKAGTDQVWARQKEICGTETPSEYSRPYGDVLPYEVSDELYKLIEAGAFCYFQFKRDLVLKETELKPLVKINEIKTDRIVQHLINTGVSKPVKKEKKEGRLIVPTIPLDPAPQKKNEPDLAHMSRDELVALAQNVITELAKKKDK